MKERRDEKAPQSKSAAVLTGWVAGFRTIMDSAGAAPAREFTTTVQPAQANQRPYLRAGLLNWEQTMNRLAAFRTGVWIAATALALGPSPSQAQTTEVHCTAAGGRVTLGFVFPECRSYTPTFTITQGAIHLHLTWTRVPLCEENPCLFPPWCGVASAFTTEPLADGVYTVTVQIQGSGPQTWDPITISCACPADWNADGQVNSQDIAAFVTSWLASLQLEVLHADFNADGAVDSADISAFITAWLAAAGGEC